MKNTNVIFKLKLFTEYTLENYLFTDNEDTFKYFKGIRQEIYNRFTGRNSIVVPKVFHKVFDKVVSKTINKPYEEYSKALEVDKNFKITGFYVNL